MESKTPHMIKYEKPEDNRLYREHATSFDLLEIDTAGKSIPELYQELIPWPGNILWNTVTAVKRTLPNVNSRTPIFTEGIFICSNILKDSLIGFTR